MLFPVDNVYNNLEYFCDGFTCTLLVFSSIALIFQQSLLILSTDEP